MSKRQDSREESKREEERRREKKTRKRETGVNGVLTPRFNHFKFVLFDLNHPVCSSYIMSDRLVCKGETKGYFQFVTVRLFDIIKQVMSLVS